jgi:hypothetical protein
LAAVPGLERGELTQKGKKAAYGGRWFGHVGIAKEARAGPLKAGIALNKCKTALGERYR